jgi:RNA polymerase sigma-70 factor (ECF subfamily)
LKRRDAFSATRSFTGTSDFDRLFAEYGPALARLAGSYTNSPSDADDLLQEIAIAVWRALPGFRGECSERTFLYRIAHNRAIAYLARNRPRAVTAGAAGGDEMEIPDHAPSAEAQLVREQQGRRLLDAVRRLPVLYRQVVTLVLEGLEYGEIAQIMGISESNVGARLTRARQKLRKLLEGR